MECIKNLRENLGLRQEDIAKVLKIKRSTYASYETERNVIPIKYLNVLSNYFNVSIDYLIGITKTLQYENSKKEINMNLFAIRIKELRKINKITQMNMALLLNISRSTWTGYEYGKYQIPTLFLKEIATRYHTSVDYLLGKVDVNNL